MDDQKFNIFQIGLMIFFGAMAVIGVIVLATNKNDNTTGTVSTPVVIWGPPFQNQAMPNLISEIQKKDDSFERVTYVEKNTATLYGDLLEAIVTGSGPDMVVMSSSAMLSLKNKLYALSFETVPLSTYKGAFVDGADIFVLKDGVYALPLLVDPLVLYWNKNIFAANAVAQVPDNWDTFNQLVPRLSKIVGGANLTQSGVAFGEYDNVLHAKEILTALFMQTGSSIIEQGDNGKFYVDLSDPAQTTKPSLALSFYTSFSNPNKTVYAWNKTFDRSREAFAANKVAMYAGLVSEEKTLLDINPNLNFDVAMWPQIKDAAFNATYGEFYGIAILKTSQNPGSAYYVAQTLSSKENAARLSQLSGLPSVRRDVLTEGDVTDPFNLTKTRSAIIAHSWLEPVPQTEVNDIFARTVNGIVAGTLTSEIGIAQMVQDLGVLVDPYND